MSSPSSSASLSRWPLWSALPLGLALAGLLGLYLVGAYAALQAPRSLEYGEPFIVSASWNLSQGGSLYEPVEDRPWLHNNYHPLVQSVTAPILGQTGPSYWPGRIVTILAVLGLLALVGHMVFLETGTRPAGLIAMTLPLGAGFVFPWLALGRVDAVAALFSVTAALWSFHFREGSAKQRGFALVFAWLAFAAKQSVVGGIAAALLYALVRGRVKECFGFGLLFTAGCAAIVGGLAWWTDGQSWLHTVVYNASHDRGPLWPQTLPPLEMAATIGFGLILGVLAFAPALRWRQHAPYMLWAVVSFALAFWLVRKSGAHRHYFLETIVALSVLATLGGVNTMRRALSDSKRSCRVWTAMLLLAIPLAMVPNARETYGRVKGLWTIDREPRAMPVEVARVYRDPEAEKPLLLARAGSFAVEAGHAAIFDVADFVRLVQLGRFDPEARLLPAVRAGRFPVIVEQVFENSAAAKLFSVAAIPGLSAALEVGYRAQPELWRDERDLIVARIWMPREER